jgi:hypothetical protein
VGGAGVERASLNSAATNDACLEPQATLGYRPWNGRRVARAGSLRAGALRICETTIAKGELRVAEQESGRYDQIFSRLNHFSCVVENDLNLAQRALYAPRTPTELRKLALAESI